MKKIGRTILAVVILLSCCITFSACSEKKDTGVCYNIEVELIDNTLFGKMGFYYTNTSENAIDELKFNLYANAYREGAKYSPVSAGTQYRAYPNGVNYGNIKINKVYTSDAILEYNVSGLDQNILVVSLSKAIYPEQSVNIVIEYEIVVADVISRLGINEKTINLANFYPILCAYEDGKGFYECVYYSHGDPYYSQVADYNVKITLDKEYVVAGSGSIIGKSESIDKNTFTFTLQNARSFCLVLSKEFDILTEKVGDTRVNYYFYDDENAKAHLDVAVKSIKLFSSLFGTYPYKEYSVVQTKFVQGGMEFPALVMISDDLGDAYGEVIVHETAHQWWQTLVGNNEIEHAFLDEGLAEYSVVLFYERYSEYGFNRQKLMQVSHDTYKVFCSVSDKLYGKVDTKMLRGLGEFKSEYEYVNMAYVKPCIMYDMLRITIGDKMFFKGLSKYFNQYMYKNVGPYEIVGVFEKIGADANGFFQSFYDGKVII